MDSYETQLTLLVYINDSSDSFEMKSKNIIKIDEIKNKAKNDFKITEELLYLDTYKDNKEIKTENDIIFYSSEDKEGNLKCEIRLHTRQKKNENNDLSQQTTQDVNIITDAQNINKKIKNEIKGEDKNIEKIKNEKKEKEKENLQSENKGGILDFEGETNKNNEKPLFANNNESLNINKIPISDIQDTKIEEKNNKEGEMDESQGKKKEDIAYSDTISKIDSKSKIKLNEAQVEVGDKKNENNNLSSNKDLDKKVNSLLISDKKKLEKESNGDNSYCLNESGTIQGADNTKNGETENPPNNTDKNNKEKKESQNYEKIKEDEKLIKDFEELKNKNEKVSEEYEKLKKEYEELKKEKIKNENNQELEKTKKELEQKKKEFEELKTEKLKNENEKNKELKEINDKYEELKKEKTLIENQKENLSKEVQKNISEFNEIEEKYKKQIIELQRENNSFIENNKKENQKNSKESIDSEKIKKIEDYQKKIENLKKENESLKLENEKLKKEKEENKNQLQNKETKNDINNKNISSNSINEKDEINSNNVKPKSFDYRNKEQVNQINGESNQNEKEEISISSLQLKIETLKNLLKTKNEKIKELENKLDENNEKSKELKNINKEKKKEVLNEKGEQIIIKSESKINTINDNGKKEKDKKELNSNLENQNNDLKEEKNKNENESYTHKMLQKILNLNELIYQNQINQYNIKKQLKEVSDTSKYDLGEINEKLNSQNDNNENKHLNNIIDNPKNNIIHSGADTQNDYHGNNNQEIKAGNNEIKNNNKEFDTISIYNHKYKEDEKTKIPCQTENAQNNTNQNNNQEGIQNNSNNSNINNVNNNMGETQSSNTDGKYQKQPISRNKSEKNEKGKKTDIENYINELKKIREKLPHITIYSDNYILDVLRKNNGDLEKSEKIIIDNYKNYQKQNS